MSEIQDYTPLLRRVSSEGNSHSVRLEDLGRWNERCGDHRAEAEGNAGIPDIV